MNQAALQEPQVEQQPAAIREAEFRDCKRVSDFLRDQHERLGLKRKFSPDQVRKTVQVTSQNKKLHNCWIVEIDGQVEGVLIGVTNRIWYSSEREAFDMAFIVSDKGKGYGGRLARRFISWARKEAVGVTEIMMSESLGADARLEQMLERLGMRHVGNVYRMEVTP